MGSEMVMVPLSNNVADMTNVLTLNEVGADILKVVVEASTIDEVVEKLLKVYDVDKAVLRADVAEFIDKALEMGVVDKVSLESR